MFRCVYKAGYGKQSGDEPEMPAIVPCKFLKDPVKRSIPEK